MKGKLIVLDGVDASGKTTQLEILCDRLQGEGKNIGKIEFPNYNNPSSVLVRMYLKGEFGEDPNNVNAYAASLFYAVDRYASFEKYWKKDYDIGKIFVAGRYVSSNAIHQTVKIEKAKRDEYLIWLDDLEYNKLQLPRPDLVIFLDMPPTFSLKLMDRRYDNDESKKDIHEKDKKYLEDCYNTALYACEKFSWRRIKCSENNKLRSIESIHEDVYNAVLEVL